MRRQIIILCALLFFASPVVGQWPDSFIGDYMEPSGQSHSIVMYLNHTVNVWEIPSPEKRDHWYGTLMFDFDCDGIDVAILNLSLYRGRDGTYPMSYVLTLPWNADAGAYLITSELSWGNYLTLLTVLNSTDSVLVQGTFIIDNGKFVWKEDYPIREYNIVPDVRYRIPSGTISPD